MQTDQHYRNEIDKTIAFSVLANQLIADLCEVLKKSPEGVIYEVERPYTTYAQGTFGAVVDPILKKFQNGWYVDIKISNHKVGQKTSARVMVMSFRLKENMTEQGIKQILSNQKDDVFVSGFVKEHLED